MSSGTSLRKTFQSFSTNDSEKSQFLLGLDGRSRLTRSTSAWIRHQFLSSSFRWFLSVKFMVKVSILRTRSLEWMTDRRTGHQIDEVCCNNICVDSKFSHSMDGYLMFGTLVRFIDFWNFKVHTYFKILMKTFKIFYWNETKVSVSCEIKVTKPTISISFTSKNIVLIESHFKLKDRFFHSSPGTLFFHQA